MDIVLDQTTLYQCLTRVLKVIQKFTAIIYKVIVMLGLITRVRVLKQSSLLLYSRGYAHAMEKCTLESVNNYLNTNIYSYLETYGDQISNLFLNVVHFFKQF
jgi:hypothetical protein